MKIFEVGLDATTLAFLKKGGITVESEELNDVEELFEWLAAYKLYDAIVIDLDATRWGTLAVRYLRSRKVLVPIIGLSHGNAEMIWSEQRATFLENGGDDFIKNPANPRELAASLRAVTRRGHDVLMDVREFKNKDALVRVNLGTFRVMVNDQPIHLTGKELRLLAVLAASGGRTQSKEHILSELYTVVEDEAEMKIIDVFVCKIRKKLNDAHPDAGDILETVWGQGYRLLSPERELSAAAVA